MFGSRNTKARVNDLKSALDELGYDLVKVHNLGIDPGMGYYAGIVVGVSKVSKQYAVWRFSDWTYRKDQADRGVELYHGTYGMDAEEAGRLAYTKYTKAKRDYDWESPKTGRAYSRTED